MGQLIEVEHALLGPVAIFDTDRSFSGQDGETFSDGVSAAEAGTFGGIVAQALLEHDSKITSVYVYSNAISVKHTKDWTQKRAESAAEIIRNSLIYYEENRV